MLHRKPLRTQPDEVHMRTLFEHQPRRLDRVRQPLHASHAARPQILSVHQQRVQLHPSVARKKRSPPRIEGLVILHHYDRRFDRLHRSPAALQHRIPCVERVGDPALMRLDLVVRHRPRAAMNQ
jgi:hypothetical protein